MIDAVYQKGLIYVICMLFLLALGTVCFVSASNAAYHVPIGTGAENLVDNLAPAFTEDFANGTLNSLNGWSEDIRITTDSAASFSPAIAVDTTNNVHITWRDRRDGNSEIYYTKLDNSGTTQVDDIRITTDSADSWNPEIAVDTANNVHITWYDNRDGNHDYEIYYTKLDNNGTKLVDDIRLTTDSEHPSPEMQAQVSTSDVLGDLAGDRTEHSSQNRKA